MILQPYFMIFEKLQIIFFLSPPNVEIETNSKLYLFYNNNTRLQIGYKVILVGGT